MINVCIKCNPVSELINDPACRDGMYCPLHGEDFILEVQDRDAIWHAPEEAEQPEVKTKKAMSRA